MSRFIQLNQNNLCLLDYSGLAIGSFGSITKNENFSLFLSLTPTHSFSAPKHILMDLAVSFSSSLSSPFSPQLSLRPNAPQLPRSLRGIFVRKPPPFFSRQNHREIAAAARVSKNDDFVLEDVPHLTNFLPELPVHFFVLFLLAKMCCYITCLVLKLFLIIVFFFSQSFIIMQLIAILWTGMDHIHVYILHNSTVHFQKH